MYLCVYVCVPCRTTSYHERRHASSRLFVDEQLHSVQMLVLTFPVAAEMHVITVLLGLEGFDELIPWPSLSRPVVSGIFFLGSPPRCLKPKSWMTRCSFLDIMFDIGCIGNVPFSTSGLHTEARCMPIGCRTSPSLTCFATRTPPCTHQTPRRFRGFCESRGHS